MKKVPRLVLAVVLGLLVLLTGVWLGQDWILRLWAERGIHKQTGLETSIGQLQYDWGAAELRLRDLQLSNGPEFGGGTMLQAPKIRMVMARGGAPRGAVHFHELVLEVSEVNLVRNRAGRLNVTPLGMKDSGSDRAPAAGGPTSREARPGGYAFGGIDTLVVTLGRVTYTDLRYPENSTVLDLDIEGEVVTGLETVDDVKGWLATLLLRITIQNYLEHPAQSRSKLLELLFQGLKPK